VDLATGTVRTYPGSYAAATGTYSFDLRTLPEGSYRAELRAAEVTDLSGNHLRSDFVLPFSNAKAVHVAGRHVFYNGSAFDGGSAGADARDAAAIAADKQALLPGGSPAYANVTNYARGINGVMVDVARLATTHFLTAADFAFRVGAGGDPATWAATPAPSGFNFARGAGVNGTDRATFVWPDGVIRNAWLQVTLKANANTGLSRPDVFYYGNLVGEAGDRSSPWRVGAADLLAIRQHFTPPAAPSAATPDSRYDVNRDGRVNLLDFAVARSNLLHALRPIVTAAVPAASVSSGPAPLPPTAEPPTPEPKAREADSFFSSLPIL
jgi:hypothetical protein